MDRMRNVDGHINLAEGPRRDAMEFKWDSNTRSYCGDGHNYHITNKTKQFGPTEYAVFIFRGDNVAVGYEHVATLPTLDQAKQWCKMHHAVGADND